MKTKLLVRVDKRNKIALKIYAAKYSITMSSLINQMIDKWIKEEILKEAQRGKNNDKSR